MFHATSSLAGPWGCGSPFSSQCACLCRRGGNYATTNSEGTTSCHQVSVRGDNAFHVFVVEGADRWKGGLDRAKREGGTRFASNEFQGFILKPGRLILIEVDARPFRIPAASPARWKALGCPLNY